MAQAMEEELAALAAEFESAGPQPSQPREPNTAAQARTTQGQEEQAELMEQHGDDAEPGNSLAKRSRLS